MVGIYVDHLTYINIFLNVLFLGIVKITFKFIIEHVHIRIYNARLEVEIFHFTIYHAAWCGWP